ncbi:MAG: DUF1232 domain-containing protein [Candidatus Peribacteraceae bacterium]|nr:DUF1232 domain-containing protein [Candidatus Peribacteraceae bacterium]
MAKKNEWIFKGFLLLVLVGYAILPVDILPDIIPFVGTLDDATLALIVGYMLKD